MSANTIAAAVSDSNGSRKGRAKRSARTPSTIAANPAKTTSSRSRRPWRSARGSTATHLPQPTAKTSATAPPRRSTCRSGSMVRRSSCLGPASPSTPAAVAMAQPCRVETRSTAHTRIINCDSVKSITTAPRCSPAPCGSARLFLEAHGLLGVHVRRQFLVAGLVAVLAQDIGDKVAIGLIIELARTVGRHFCLHEAKERRDIGGVPMAGKRRALERRAADLAVVEPGAVAVETIVRIGGLTAIGLVLGE